MSSPGIHRTTSTERLLREARPHATERLVTCLAAQVPAARGSRRLGARLALAAMVSAALAVALGAAGGIGYAASTVNQVVHAVTHKSAFMGERMQFVVRQTAAATDQYGQSENAKAETVSTTSTSDTTIDVPAPAGGGSTVTLVVPPAAAQEIAATAGTADAVIHIDPTPANAPTGMGTNNVAVGIVVSDSHGNVVHVTLSAPLSVTLHGPITPGYRPCIAENDDAGACEEVPLLPNGAVTACSQLKTHNGHTDGYYASGDDIVIQTCHLTIFAVVHPGNLATSESGRKFAGAGSGKFGDPELVKPGKATLRQAGDGVKVAPFKSMTGKAVSFQFFVDEQAAAYIRLYEGSKPVNISLHGTMVRGTTLSKQIAVKTLHIPVLRPGTLSVRLRVPGGLKPGSKYRLRVSALDFDGNRTVAFIPFTG